MMNSHEHYLLHAVNLAAKARGDCAPNPAVGAVIVKDNQIIAEGYHQQAGKPHAEPLALAAAGEKAQGATLYVSLEPCCHWGKTPPCTEAIIQSGIKRVYYGLQDPNPIVYQRGAAQLQAAGIPCEPIAIPAINQFYAAYQWWQRHRQPFITAKLALSLDGKSANAHGQPAAITSEEAMRFTHHCRRAHDAILTTAKTILHDDPQLNARVGDVSVAKTVYIIDRELTCPATVRVLKTAKEVVVFHDTAFNPTRSALAGSKVRFVGIPAAQQQLSLLAIAKTIGEEGRHDLWVEAGGGLFSKLKEAKLLNKALIYIAPKCLGESAHPAFTQPMELAKGASLVSWRPLGTDVVCEVTYEGCLNE
jgi:diaminohydroxyphosphoribosylaminopyrimidine deaminase/5-amino-6-(5-phosphoribosylamino)uracil reductase